MALEFDIKLKDGVSDAAMSAAKQVQLLNKQMLGLQNAMVKANALGDEKSINKLSDQYKKLGSAVEQLKPKMAAQEAATKNASDAIANGAEQSAMAGKAALVLEGAVIAAAAAFAALAVAAISAGAALSVANGESRKAFEATTAAMLGNAAAVAGVNAMISKLSAQLPVAKEQLQQMSTKFATAGIKDIPRLEFAIRATTAATALLGEGAGSAVSSAISKFEEMIRLKQGIWDLNGAIAGTGLTAEDMGKQFGLSGKQLQEAMAQGLITTRKFSDEFQNAIIKKGAGSVAAANMKISVQFQRLKDKIGEIFAQVIDTPGYQAFLHALDQFGILFSKFFGGAKSGATVAFDFIFKVIAKTMIFGAILTLKFAAALLRLYVIAFPIIHAFAEIGRWISKFYTWLIKAIVANQNFIDGLKVLGVALAAAGAGLMLMILPMWIAVGAVAALVAGLIWLAGWIKNNIIPILKGVAIAFLLPVAPVVALVAIFFWAKDKLVEWAKSGATIAQDFIQGIIQGITGKKLSVGKAIAGVGDTMNKAIKESLDAHSPSRVMIGVGQDVTAGLEIGMEKGSPSVATTAKNLGNSAIDGISQSGGVGGGKAITVNVASGAIVINGGGDKGMLELTEEALTALLERILMEQGGLST